MIAIMAALLVLASPPPEAPATTEPSPTSLVWVQEDTTSGPSPADVVEDLVLCVERALAEEPRCTCEILEGCAVRLSVPTGDPVPSIRACLDRARRQIGGAP